MTSAPADQKIRPTPAAFEPMRKRVETLQDGLKP